jgi:plastocyanin
MITIMNNLNGSKSRLLQGVIFIFAILSISNSCTKSMDYMYGTGSKGVPGTNEVWIQGMAFNPSSISVVEGTTITWTNKDAVPHTVTSNDSLFYSTTIGSGKTYSNMFSTAGTYLYHCSIHPLMTSKVIVTSTPIASAAVSIENGAFVPAIITVAAGTTITWTNKDGFTHNVTSDAGLFVGSGSINNNATYSLLFPTAGSFPYKCTIHPSMTGTVVVN